MKLQVCLIMVINGDLVTIYFMLFNQDYALQKSQYLNNLEASELS